MAGRPKGEQPPKSAAERQADARARRKEWEKRVYDRARVADIYERAVEQGVRRGLVPRSVLDAATDEERAFAFSKWLTQLAAEQRAGE